MDRPPNQRLRDLVTHAGWTFDATARAVTRIAGECGNQKVRPNRASVAHWLAGTVPAATTRAYLVEAFSRRLHQQLSPNDLGFETTDPDAALGLTVGPDPAETVHQLAMADLSRRGFLASATYSVTALSTTLAGDDSLTEALDRTVARAGATRVGLADVEAVKAVTAALNQLDEKLGGEHGRDAVVAYLCRDVAGLCHGTYVDDATRRAMLSAAAQLAWLAGWKAHDAGRDALAQRYYLQAHGLAGQGEGEAHAAWMLRYLAHHAMDIKRPDRSLQVAEAAWNRGHHLVDEGTAALLALTVARAHGFAGERREAAQWMATAETATGSGDTPWWSTAHGTPQQLTASQSAKVFEALGDHRSAEPHTTRAVVRWNPQTHPRVWALTVARLGTSQAAQGHLEQACATWTDAVQPLKAMRSGRAREALRQMRESLTTPRVRSLPAARELRAQLA